MSTTAACIAHAVPETSTPDNSDIGLWLLLGLPVVALLVLLALALARPDGLLKADFGYDQWLPASVEADERGR